LPAGLRLGSAPQGARDIAALRGSVKDGEPVVVRGVVGGRADPIAQNRAILTLLDASIRLCNALPGDTCKTPWDACCEPADVLAKNTVTVQVVDDQHKPLKAPLSTIDGLKPMSKLVVTGTADVTDDGNVIVLANGIFVEP
jgi:hypothetical protein